MPTDTAAAARPEPLSRRFWIVITVLVICELTCALEGNMVTVALTKLYGIYGDPLYVGWLATAYGLTAAATAAVFSRLGDIYGRRRLLILALACAAVGSLISYFGTNLNIVILGRAVQGASSAVLPLAFGILREVARDRRELNIGVGILGGTFSFSTGAGILIGGVIVDNAPWQAIFLVSAGVAFLSIALALAILPRSRGAGQSGRVDWIGGVSFVFPLSALLLSLNVGKAQGWNSPLLWALLVGGVAGLALWALYELRQKNPMIDLRLLGARQIAIGNMVICATALGPMIYPQVLMPLLQQPVWTGVGLGISATLAGLVKLPTNLTSSVMGVLSGYAAHRWSMRTVIIASTLANLLAWVLLLFFHDNVWWLVLAAVLLIAPAGTIMFGVAPGLIIEAAPPDQTSGATGMTSVMRAVAQAVGYQMIALCLASSMISNETGQKFPDETGYRLAFIYVTVCCVVSLALALMIPRRKAAVAELRPALAE